MHPASPASSGHPTDSLFVSIDGLVRDGTLSPDQANRVYNTVRDSAGATTAFPTAGRRHLSRPNVVVLAAAAVLLGGALVLSGSLLADILATNRQGFVWKAFVVVLGTTLALLGATAAVQLLAPGHHDRSRIASALAALGAVGAGFTVDAAFADNGGAGYVAGLLMLVVSVAGYAWLRGSPLAASAVLGGFVLLVTALGDGPDSLGSGIGASVVLVLYGVVVVAAGWLLPCRDVTGVLGGILALVGVFVGIYADVGVSAVVLGPLGVAGNDTGDVGVATGIGFLVVAALLGLYAITGYAGYAILGVVGATLIPPAALFAFRSGNALRWGTVVAAVGVGVIAGSVLLSRQAGTASRSNSQPYTSAS